MTEASCTHLLILIAMPILVLGISLSPVLGLSLAITIPPLGVDTKPTQLS